MMWIMEQLRTSLASEKNQRLVSFNFYEDLNYEAKKRWSNRLRCFLLIIYSLEIMDLDYGGFRRIVKRGLSQSDEPPSPKTISYLLSPLLSKNTAAMHRLIISSEST